MIQLYGLRMSNYYSLTKALMEYKGVNYEEVKAPPTQKEDNLARTPMGKMPSIGLDGVYMSESLAIATYLDRIAPEPALLPSDPFQAGKTMEIACHVKLDVELVARRCLPEAFFGQTVSDETKAEAKKDLAKGMAALQRILVCDPYAAGPELTIADFYMFYTFGLATGISQAIWKEDLLEGHDNIKALLAKLADLPAIAKVEADKAEG